MKSKRKHSNDEHSDIISIEDELELDLRMELEKLKTDLKLKQIDSFLVGDIEDKML